MDSRKRNTAIGAILVIALVISSTIVLTNAQADANYSATIQDALGRNVTISSVPQRIVSCSPDITEDIYALGLGDKLVGVTTYCNHPDDVITRKGNGSLATIGSYSMPNIEAILNQTPDVVFISSGVQAQKSMVESLENLNITVIALYKGQSFDEVYDNIRIIGKVNDHSSEANTLITNITDKISWIQSKLAGVDVERSIIDVVWLDPIYVAGGGTYVQDMLNVVNGINPFESMSGWTTVSSEAILEAQPDVIILTSTMMMTSASDLISMVRNDSVWSSTPAVKTNEVYVLSGQAENVLNRPGPRMVDGIELIADMLYPEAMGVNLPNILDSNYAFYLNKTVQYMGDSVSQTTVDGIGRTVHFSMAPELIASCAPSDTGSMGVFSDADYATLNSLKTDPMWSQINAVKNNSVCVIEGRVSDTFERPTSSIGDVIALIAMMTYPGECTHSLPNVISSDHAEYLK